MKRFVPLPLLLSLLSPPASAADIEQLLAAMTLDEKLAMLHGIKDPDPATGLNSAGYIPGVPRLGIAPLRLADGPAGIRTDVTATALAAPIALAASFDPALAHRYGEVIGMEGIARNQDVLLSPMINLIRVPQAGRNFETFGEDPLLASQLVQQEIRGIQSQGMMATVKHFAANNQEQDRLTIDVQVDERTLRELYLPAFEAAVQADVASVMCAYNMVNSAYSCENSHLLNDVLREEWGFQGYVMTDWWAQHSLNALQSGLNMEMPGWTHPEYPVLIHFDEPLRTALQPQGSVTLEQVDNALRPILVMMERFGKLDGSTPQKASFNTDNNAVATEVAVGGAVLLKNTDATLPLSAEALEHTLLVGPTAAWTLVGGGGSSRVLPSSRDDPKTALETLTAMQNIDYMLGYDSDGHVIPASALRDTASGRSGLQQIAANGERSTIESLNYVGDLALSGAGLWNWQGELTAPEDGLYELHVQTSAPSTSLYLDGKRVLFNDAGQVSNAELIPTSDGLRNSTLRIELKAGETRELKVETWTGDPRPIQMRLSWLTPSQREAAIATAVDAAREAGQVIVFAHQEGTETRDRDTLALPGYQDSLITALAGASDKVIVVLNVGAPVTMPWADDVEAILQMWYPGQTGGTATAQLLLGLQNPSGKLPVTFPRREEDTPINDPLRYPGVAGVQHYSEGLFMGYRWYDHENIEPLFPFGHGLSYTSFEYSDMAVQPVGDEVEVSFTLRNSGTRAGAEVAQVYLDQRDGTARTSDDAASAAIAVEVRKLVAFSKVMLQPAESRRIS